LSQTMKKRIWIYASFALVLLVAYFANTAIQTHLGRKALKATGLTHHDLPEAMQLARQQNKLVLADLSAIWCPSCRKLDRQVFSDADVHAAIDRQFVFARLEYDSEAGQAFKKKYGTKGFPALVVIDAKGDLVKHLPITFDPGEFVANLSALQ